MANVFYLKMGIQSQLDGYEFEDLDRNFPPKLQPGDLCFIRAMCEAGPAVVKRLWEVEKYAPGDTSVKFKPRWTDAAGNEEFFTQLEIADQFCALKLFTFNMAMGNYVLKQRKGKSFTELPIEDYAVFDAAISSAANFNTYIGSKNNFRKIQLVGTFDTNSEDIQLKKDPDGVYELNETTHIGADVVARFDGNKPNEFLDSGHEPGGAKGTMFAYLKSGGSKGRSSLLGFYDLFCTKNGDIAALARKKDSKVAAPVEDVAAADDGIVLSDDETGDEAIALSRTGAYAYDDPAIKTGGRNLIIYGTPGCGKSYKLDSDLRAIGEAEKFRVTFHMDYTYTDFVGQILPKLKTGGGVEYEFVPGPFTSALVRAIVQKEKEVALIIEEINRGNAASIFGDLFQLLDRDEKGISQYTLTNKQITDYLQKELSYTLDYIKIPANLSLYATMNTGDQNVFTLDTAFKRRWEFEKLSNIFRSDDMHKDLYIPGMSNVTWENFVKAINDYMIGGGTLDSEDKQLGKYFVTSSQLLENPGETDAAKRKRFAYKVLEYLWNDVAKFDRERWFNTGTYKTLDAVIEKWIEGGGKDVFNSNLKFIASTTWDPAVATGVSEE